MIEDFANLYRAARGGAGPDIDLMVTFQYGCYFDRQGDCEWTPASAGDRRPRSSLCARTWRQRDTFADYAPCQREYTRNVTLFKRMFPAVRTFSAWNEPNHEKQPTRIGDNAAGPLMAARYTYWLTRMCREPASVRLRCRVVAGDLAQGTSARMTRYLAGYGRLPSVPNARRGYVGILRDLFAQERDPRYQALPEIWGFHPYSDVSSDLDIRAARRAGRTYITGTDTFVRYAPRNRTIWFTEVGSRIDTNNGRYPPLSAMRNNERTQRDEVAFLFNNLGPSANAQRVYYYSLCAPRDQFNDMSAFDSALTGPMNRIDFSMPGYDQGVCAPEPALPSSAQPKRLAYCEFRQRSNPALGRCERTP